MCLDLFSVPGNVCGEKKCSHFCIPVPSGGTAVAKCVCRTGYKLVNKTQCQRKCLYFLPNVSAELVTN